MCYAIPKSKNSKKKKTRQELRHKTKNQRAFDVLDSPRGRRWQMQLLVEASPLMTPLETPLHSILRQRGYRPSSPPTQQGRHYRRSHQTPPAPQTNPSQRRPPIWVTPQQKTAAGIPRSHQHSGQRYPQHEARHPPCCIRRHVFPRSKGRSRPRTAFSILAPRWHRFPGSNGRSSAPA